MQRLLRVLFLIAIGTLFPPAEAGVRNVVWIISDDLGLELGCYGDPHVRTPHLDKLAAQGTRFTNAYSTSPVCSSSRSAFTTGCYQTTIGAHMHDMVVPRPLEKPFAPSGHLFREAGFFTSNQNGDPQKTRRAKIHYNFTEPEHYPFFMGADWYERPQKSQRFFGQVQISEPHRAFRTPLPDHIDPDKVQVPPQYPDHPVTRADWALYLAHIETLDRHVGSVMTRLEQEGILDETLIFFFGDHGRPHLWDKQWLYEGGLRVPLIARLPGTFEPGTVEDEFVSLIDLLPTSLALAGVEIPDHIEGLDFLDPEVPEREHIIGARDRCGDAPDRIRSARGQRFKLIHNFHPELPYLNHSGYKKASYPAWTVLEALHAKGQLPAQYQRWMKPGRPEFELYDLENDPHELNNLAEDPEYAKELTKLQQVLTEWGERSGDRGGEPEMDQETRDKHFALKRKRLEKTLESRGLGTDPSPAKYLKWWETHLGVETP